MALMDEVRQSLEGKSSDEIKKLYLEQQAARKANQEKQKAKLANLTPEQKAERNAKQKAYQEANKDKFLAGRAAYNKKPEVIEKRKAYMAKRVAERKALVARAKELGIVDDKGSLINA